MKEETQQFNPYEKLVNRKLTEEELREVQENLLGFVELLLETDKENRQEGVAMQK